MLPMFELPWESHILVLRLKVDFLAIESENRKYNAGDICWITLSWYKCQFNG